jgi:hypothetical protein
MAAVEVNSRTSFVSNERQPISAAFGLTLERQTETDYFNALQQMAARVIWITDKKLTREGDNLPPPSSYARPAPKCKYDYEPVTIASTRT